MALFLTGGGDQENFKRLDKTFLEKLTSGARIGIIPHAAEDFQDVLERIEQDFNHKKVNSFELIEKAPISLLDFDALIIEGGNTFDLIQAMRESSFYSLIKEFFKTGRPVYADSAGAIMLGADVHTAFLGEDGDEDAQRIQDYRGLDLISGWSVHAHATEDEYEDLNNLLYDKASPILCLAEETGILIENEIVTALGNEPLTAITFAGVKSLSSGQSSSLEELQS